MRIRIFVEPQQGATYDDILAAALRAEALGFDAFFRSDHFLRMGTRFSGLPGPTDAWLTLAGLARDTSSIRLGTLVTAATFRHPGILAIQVAQTDHMSGGRIELGLGSGWFEPEHRALGVPFPSRRFDLLEEQLAIITGLFSTRIGDLFEFHGDNYEISDSPALPHPLQPSLPIIVGGLGPERTPRLAARYAKEFNLPFPVIADIPGAFARVRRACEELSRDPFDLGYSLALVGLIGEDEPEFRRRAAHIGRDPEELRRTSVAGTGSEVSDRIALLGESGVETLYLQIWDLHDLDHLDLIARDILASPGVAGAE